MAGKIEVLNTTKGHEEVTLPEDKAEAKQKVDDMMKKGYSLFVTVEDGDKKEDKKVTGFDGETGDYLVKEIVTKKEDVIHRFPSATAKVTAVAPVAGG
jgi:hypothetical protein